MADERETETLRQRRKKSSSISLSCCFHRHNRGFDSLDLSAGDKASPTRSPSAWFRSKGQELPEIKGKCRSFISRMGRPARRHSADFSYDPLSYALNFDEGTSYCSHVDDFSSRLPLLPPLQRVSAAPRIMNLELPSSRPVGRRSAETPTAAAVGGRISVELPPPVSREILVEL